MYLNALGQPIIVMNSLKVASELLDKRANIYSDRPRMIIANEIISGGLFAAFMRYGDLCVVHFFGVQRRKTISSFADGAALVVPHAKGSQNPSCATIIRFSSRRRSCWHLRFCATPKLGISIFNDVRLLRQCPSCMTTPPWRQKMTRPSKKSTPLTIAHPKPLPLGRISLRYFLG